VKTGYTLTVNRKLVIPLIVFFATSIGLIIIDMTSKIFTDGVNTSVIPKVISFESVYNKGVAFSFLSGAGVWLIVLTSILTVAAITAWWFMGRKTVLSNVGFAFFIAGAIGNLYDRIAYGYVRDFIRFDFWPNFAIFNFADICLNVGTVLLVIYFVFFAHKKEKAPANAA